MFDKLSNESILAVLDYLCWKQRCNLFRLEFIDEYCTYGMKHYNWSPTTALFLAEQHWRLVKEKGFISAYQEFINNKEMCVCLVNALNE